MKLVLVWVSLSWKQAEFKEGNLKIFEVKESEASYAFTMLYV